MRHIARLRIGLGFDAHPLKPRRPLVLGGVHIPCRLGLDGHSDADVLLHAICDSLLGALALPDIGSLFPASDPTYRNADSIFFVEQVLRRVHQLGWRVANIDCTLVCDRPKIAERAVDIRTRIARLLFITPNRVGLKAKTTEGTMLAQPRSSIAALVVVLLEHR